MIENKKIRKHNKVQWGCTRCWSKKGSHTTSQEAIPTISISHYHFWSCTGFDQDRILLLHSSRQRKSFLLRLVSFILRDSCCWCYTSISVWRDAGIKIFFPEMETHFQRVAFWENFNIFQSLCLPLRFSLLSTSISVRQLFSIYKCVRFQVLQCLWIASLSTLFSQNRRKRLLSTENCFLFFSYADFSSLFSIWFFVQ